MCDDTRTTATKVTTATTSTNTTTPKATATFNSIKSKTKSNNTTLSRSGCLTQATTTIANNNNNNLANTKFNTLDSLSGYSPSISVLTPIKADPTLVELTNPAFNTHTMLLTQRRRRFLQRHACLLSIVAAFVVGLLLGVLAPMFNMSQFYAEQTQLEQAISSGGGQILHLPLIKAEKLIGKKQNQNNNLNQLKPMQQQTTQQPQVATRPPSDFPTIYGLQAEQPTAEKVETNPYAVAFVKEQPVELSAEEVFRNAFHLEQLKDKPDTMLVKKLDAEDGSIKEFQVERLSKGRFRKGPERRLSKPTLTETMLATKNVEGKLTNHALSIVPLAQRILANAQADKQHHSIIKNDIYWGDLVEKALPQGFSEQDAKSWNHYVNNEGRITQFENGCGRMQNRLVIFADGTKACARYRQNTDQIQGEIFSFYLGQLLNISNLAPSVATVVDLNSDTWSSALADITQAQWKQQRPVVLTRWLPDLEPAGIPQPFQPLERHLNKYDVWNITLNNNNNNKMNKNNSSILLQRLNNSQNEENLYTSSSLRQHNQSASTVVESMPMPPTTITTTTTTPTPTPAVLQRLVELAQWSDLIVFDYLIANLDRVVNNLYNFQWNADIMAAPAHNLARQMDTQLLVFLDNESGLLHGYRLLKKYEAYHGVLLDNLCVFRQPTIDALRQLRSNGPGRMLRDIFERTTSNQVRDVLPSLPDKSIKILVDRIDRVLGQVQKCKDLLGDR